MATITVTSTAGLATAFQQAHGGDTILLAPGTYTANLYKYQPAGTVTITSLDPSNPAVISDLHVNLSSGLNSTNLTFASTLSNPSTNNGAASPWVVYSSQNISFDHISVHGTLDQNAQNDINGLGIQGSTNVSITNSEFQQLYNAITESGNTGVTISNNIIHDIRADGVDNQGSSNVVISGNTFTNFYPVGAVGTTGDHPDAIQFWTSNTTADTNNITVTNNTVVRGSGSWIQGIFITDQVGLHYNNVTVTGNKMFGTAYNGIMVTNANNANVSNNIVEGYSDMVSWIRLSNDTSVALNNNVANSLFQDTVSSFTGQLNNQWVGAVAPVTSADVVVVAPPITTVAQTIKVSEYGKVSGNALTGDTGTSLSVIDVGVGSALQQLIPATGSSSFAGQYGTLTIQANGAYTYTETKQSGLIVGQTYDDHFTLTVGGAGGGAALSTLDVIMTVSGVGDGKADIINAGAGPETISNFGAGSVLTSGTGPDTFYFSGLSSSTPKNQTVIQNFKSGDIIDISRVDPYFHVVNHFTGHANELVLSHVGTGNWEVYGDTTGSGSANFAIHLLGVPSAFSLSAAAFHL